MNSIIDQQRDREQFLLLFDPVEYHIRYKHKELMKEYEEDINKGFIEAILFGESNYGKRL